VEDGGLNYSMIGTVAPGASLCYYFRQFCYFICIKSNSYNYV